jgi:hypothetical protein
VEPDGGGAVDAVTRIPPSPQFAGLYDDIFSIAGVARCQHPSCHGGEDGNAGLSMGADAYDLYRAITSYTYDGKLLVSPEPGGDSRAGSAILVVLEPDDPIMPRVDEDVGNRTLTREEWQRIEQWLQVGAPY